MKEKSQNYDDVYEVVKNKVGLSRKEFDEKVSSLIDEYAGFITPRAAALIIAKELGINIDEIVNPPVIGRLLEVGPTRKSSSASGETPYVLFVLVNEESRIWCVAFGKENIDKLRALEDKVIRIRGYTKAKIRGRDWVRVTEKSIIEELDDSALPEITKLKPAWAGSLKEVKESFGSFIVKTVVVEEDTSEYFACPICKRSLDVSDSEFTCIEHGPVEPIVRKVYHYTLSDPSGVYSAVFFGDPPEEKLFKKFITVKGYFKGDEFQISKIYEVSEKP
ncbi:MAG: hypothetical protein ACP6IS_07450 [Candidatus Asgardarchaeia archaeon]